MTHQFHAPCALVRHLARLRFSAVASIDDIRLTLAAAEVANFGSVARARHVSQSTVSRAVQRVEAATGGALFAREGRRVSVLPSASAAAVLTGLAEIAERWQALTERTGRAEPARLAIFCTVTASQTIAPDLLAAFRHAYPHVVLDLRTGPASNALDAARSGEVDAAIAPLPARLPRTMVSVELTTTPLTAVVATGMRVSRTWDGAHIIVPRSGVTRDLVDTWAHGALPRTHTIQETDSHEEVVALAALGSGIGIVPRLVVESSPLRPRLREITPPVRLPTMRLGLCARRSAITTDPLAQLWSLLG